MSGTYHRLRRWAIGGVQPVLCPPAWWTALGLIAGLAFVALLVAVVTGSTLATDDAVELGVHAHASAGLTVLMQDLTTLGYIPTLAGAVAVIDLLLLRVRRRIEALLLTGAMVGEGFWDDVVKFAVRRPRPHLFPRAAIHSFSFPSGHAFATLCLLVIVVVLIWRHLPGLLRWLTLTVALLLAFGIGASRVYLGVHYPSDVIGGWFAAGAWLGAVATWLRRRHGVTAGRTAGEG
jgi:undecaprenyl-diphosphatase